ncbi:MAG TPA: response regulator [Polyangiaceae bacterium]|nr:response regulator [Polyangiaceae bacterium]
MNPPRPVVLVIDDEAPMRRFLRAALVSSGYQVLEAETGEQGITLAASHNPELVLLDLGLPDLDGLVVTQRLREWSLAPIVVVSARGQENDKILALDGGADDYLTKPFAVGELLARLRVALRHAAGQKGGDPVFESGELRVDLGRRQVQIAGREVHLTPIEYRLLVTLVKYAGRVVTHRQLLREVWGPHAGEQVQYLRVYMAQLRHKLEATPGKPRYLVTEPGVGYRLRLEER